MQISNYLWVTHVIIRRWMEEPYVCMVSFHDGCSDTCLRCSGVYAVVLKGRVWKHERL